MAPFAEWIEFDSEVPAHLSRQHWKSRPAYASEEDEAAVEIRSAPVSSGQRGLWSPHPSAVGLDVGFFMRQTSGSSGNGDAEEPLPSAVPEDRGGLEGDALFLRQATDDSDAEEFLPPGTVPEESDEMERFRRCSKEEVASTRFCSNEFPSRPCSKEVARAAAETPAPRSLAQARERAFDDVPALPCLVARRKPGQDALAMENAIGIW